MFCRTVFPHKNRPFFFKVYVSEASNFLNQNVFSKPHNPRLEQSLLVGKKSIRNYVIYYSAGKQIRVNVNKCILKETNICNLGVSSRFLHSFIMPPMSKNKSFRGYTRQKSTDISNLSRSKTIPSTSINIEDVLRNAPIPTGAEKISNVLYVECEKTNHILKLYPQPKNVLHNIFDKLSMKINRSLKLYPEYQMVSVKNHYQWASYYHLFWPEEIRFFAIDFEKRRASCKAAVTALTWLKYKNSITDKGQPIFSLENVAQEEENEIYYQDNEDSRQVLKDFPNSKNVLHNVFDEVVRQTTQKSLKIDPHYRLIKDGKNSEWLCTYHIYWPQEIKVCAKDPKKSRASHKAAVAALTWLKKNKKITKDGLPVIFGKEEAKQITKKDVPILSFNTGTINKMQNIVQLYQTQIEPHIIPNKLEKYEREDEIEEESNVIKEPEEVNLKKVRRQKYLSLEKYLAKENVELPIAAYKNDFINMLKENQIVIVKGEPGCGKSTRVPQYVLEAWAREDGLLGEPGRIAVTQPRRIAAISLAERVAVERSESVGSIVGYQVRLKSNFNSSTGRILYCTTGILLRHFQSDSNLSSFTHIILDEAHERDVNTDLLMNLLRSACKTNPKLKLIVMSATIDTNMFSEYFGGAPIMDIPGFTYPVKQYFLDSCKMDVNKTLAMCESNTPSVVHEDVARVIKYIHKNKKEGAMLCFLPGWEDISKIHKLIPENRDLVVYCLHSRLQDSDQWKIFSRPPPGVRKVILATNIAETSVTIDDVVYVIDTGIHKEQRFDVEKGVNCIDNHWISKASANQRKGRAGRVQPGESFHLYTKEKYASFPDYSLPEIQRTSLTKIVLDSKVFSNNMNALKFMSQLPTPPEENATLRAVEELKDLEMLNKNESLTSLGKTCSEFQLEPKLSKALINSVIFKCVTPMVDIVTLFSADTEFFVSGLLHKEDIKNTKRLFCTNSDHLAMMRLFEKWLQYYQDGDEYSVRRFCNETNLVPHRIQTIEKLRKIHYDYLYNGLYDVLPISDDLSDNDEIVKAVLYSGAGTVLQYRNWDIVKQKLKNNVHCLLTRNNHRATITTESVNSRRSKFPTNFLLYINETRSNMRRTTLVRECSFIPNISVLLFSNKDLVMSNVDKENLSQDISLEDPVKISIQNTNISSLCDRTQAEDLIQCKNSIMAVYRYYIERLTDGGMCNSDVNQSWDSILALIGDILNTYSVKN